MWRLNEREKRERERERRERESVIYAKTSPNLYLHYICLRGTATPRPRGAYHWKTLAAYGSAAAVLLGDVASVILLSVEC